MLRVLGCLLVSLLLACSHTDKPDGPTGLKKAAEEFLLRIRFKDFGSASNLLVPEKKEDFIVNRHKAHDDADLSILDYDIEQLKLSPDAMSGQVETQFSYSRLPSVSVKNDEVTLFFVFRDNRWLVDHMVGGPFEDLR